MVTPTLRLDGGLRSHDTAKAARAQRTRPVSRLAALMQIAIDVDQAARARRSRRYASLLYADP